jgi:hypothetical protein
MRRVRRTRGVHAVFAIDEAIAGIASMPAGRAVAIVTREPDAEDPVWAAGLERSAVVALPSRQFAAHPAQRWRRALAGIRELVGIPHGGRPGSRMECDFDLRAHLGLSRHGPLAVTHGPIDLECTGSWDRLQRARARVVAVVESGSSAADALRAVARRIPRRLAIVEPEHPCAAAARACADLHIFASAYQPCAESALAAAAGKIAIAHSSGEYCDRIVSWDPASQSGNGLLFSSGELLSSLIVASRDASVDRLLRAAGALDTGWRRPARAYANLAHRVAENWNQ